MKPGLPNTLEVLIGKLPIGLIEVETGGMDQTRFSFLPSYRELARRPVLGQTFIDKLESTWTARVRVPAFFSNLLPEGALRALLARHAGVNAVREFFLLAALGGDLPGNVVVRPLGPLDAAGELEHELPADGPAQDALRFSVAGLQLKFSVSQQQGRWTVPLRGQGGRWLLKLPSRSFRDVPRNEFWTMRYARHLGLAVADTELIHWREVAGLEAIRDADIAKEEELALLVRRFDRAEGDERTHVEDFLQILDRFPDSSTKYRAGNYDQFGRLIRALMGDAALDEYVRRITFNAAMGNGDAHLKNWMLRYADGITASLSPAFDLVSTVQYEATDQDEFALNFGRVKRYDEFATDAVERFIGNLRIAGKQLPDSAHLLDVARDFAARARAEWPQFARAHDVPPGFSERLAAHWGRVPLMS